MRLLAVGDWGTPGSVEGHISNAMTAAAQGAAGVISLGDNFYPTGVKSTSDAQWQTTFERPFAALQTRFLSVLGNHDYMGNVDAQVSGHCPQSALLFCPEP